MSKAIPSYEERLRNPGLELINFSYLLTHPESIYEVWLRYKTDVTFKMQLTEKMYLNPIFKQKFYETFKHYLANEAKEDYHINR